MNQVIVIELHESQTWLWICKHAQGGRVQWVYLNTLVLREIVSKDKTCTKWLCCSIHWASLCWRSNQTVSHYHSFVKIVLWHQPHFPIFSICTGLTLGNPGVYILKLNYYLYGQWSFYFSLYIFFFLINEQEVWGVGKHLYVLHSLIQIW